MRYVHWKTLTFIPVETSCIPFRPGPVTSDSMPVSFSFSLAKNSKRCSQTVCLELSWNLIDSIMFIWIAHLIGMPLFQLLISGVKRLLRCSCVTGFPTLEYHLEYTDQGCQFNSELFNVLCWILGFHRIRITAYHLQANGRVERS